MEDEKYLEYARLRRAKGILQDKLNDLKIGRTDHYLIKISRFSGEKNLFDEDLLITLEATELFQDFLSKLREKIEIRIKEAEKRMEEI